MEAARQLAQNFLDQYYTCQSTNRAGLLNFYTEDSCMSYNGDQNKGVKAIKHKIESLGFKTVSLPHFTPNR
jgi:hypothetical protein